MENKFIQRSFKNYFSENPERCGKILSAFNREKCHISSADSPELEVLPFFSQLWEGRNVTTLEEDLICATLWQRIIQNKLTYLVQETPHCFSDAQIDENKNLVKSYISNVINQEKGKIINADFWGGKRGEDGFIQFSNPPLGNVTRFPLEIGYVTPSQFYYHIYYSKCIARLPYRSDYIVYFEDLELGSTI